KGNTIKALTRINDIRNDIAHFPHRFYKRGKNHLMYNGRNIFKDVKALEDFRNDFDSVLDEVVNLINNDENP
ncbi:MAG: hypothetical protein PHY46_05085, partial [Candidatus Omnitrophica bacterium]|nr:hypothetical protein [Candidatus Omnitrophota bacterium]